MTIGTVDVKTFSSRLLCILFAVCTYERSAAKTLFFSGEHNKFNGATKTIVFPLPKPNYCFQLPIFVAPLNDPSSRKK